MPRTAIRREHRTSRHARVRTKVRGVPQRPRLNVFRSLRHIYAQVIDDTTGSTLAAVSTKSPALTEGFGGGAKTELAEKVGSAIAKQAREAGVTHVVFDRGGYKYHGRVKALAEAARKGGLEF
jgi:large subunit ribosomal protein L18